MLWVGMCVCVCARPSVVFTANSNAPFIFLIDRRLSRAFLCILILTLVFNFIPTSSHVPEYFSLNFSTPLSICAIQPKRRTHFKIFSIYKNLNFAIEYFFVFTKFQNIFSFFNFFFFVIRKRWTREHIFCQLIAFTPTRSLTGSIVFFSFSPTCTLLSVCVWCACRHLSSILSCPYLLSAGFFSSASPADESSRV